MKRIIIVVPDRSKTPFQGEGGGGGGGEGEGGGRSDVWLGGKEGSREKKRRERKENCGREKVWESTLVQSRVIKILQNKDWQVKCPEKECLPLIEGESKRFF